MYCYIYIYIYIYIYTHTHTGGRDLGADKPSKYEGRSKVLSFFQILDLLHMYHIFFDLHRHRTLNKSPIIFQIL